MEISDDSFIQEWGTGARSRDAPSEEGKAMVLWHESACRGRRGFRRGAHDWSYCLPMKPTSTSSPSCCGRKTRLFWAMRATPAMNTNADHGSWEYAGVCKTNASPDRISRWVRRSVTGSIPQSVHGWNMCFGWSNGSLDLPGSATAGWWRMLFRWTCWWIWPICTCCEGDCWLVEGGVRSKYPWWWTMKHKQGKFGNKMLQKNELPGVRV